MKLSNNWLLFVLIFLGSIWFLGFIKEIITPFLLAGIFAYLLNPVVTFAERRIRISRGIVILFVYIVFIGLLIFFGTLLTEQVVHESSDLQLAVKNVDTVTRTQIAELPRWLQPSVKEALVSLEQSKYFSAKSLIALFPQAVTKAFSVLIFLFSAFYFLKDGNKFISLLLRFVSLKKRSDISSLLTEIADVFGKYLRGQIFLVFLVALTLFIGLSFLGVRYSLLIAIFSGFAELIPIIGPLAAWGIAGIVGLLYGSKAFTDPTQLLLFVSILYLVLRQIQDYVINPYVLGRLTKLHPLVVLFAVVLGGHFYGVLGLVMAVPFAAMIKIVLEHFFFERSQKEKIS